MFTGCVRAHPVRIVDVFSAVPFRGNALAVIHDADDLSDTEMATIARWTNLSETTFLCAPGTAEADYRVRIFTTGGELPFAGHPTLGSAHSWLEAGGTPRREPVVVQECGAGLVPVSRGEVLAFAAPPLVRSGPVAQEDADRVLRLLRLGRDDVIDLAWTDNGPGWISVELPSAEAVLDIVPDTTAAAGLAVGVVGRYAVEEEAPDGALVEVRAFYDDGAGLFEDPVTGSLNAGIAQWLIGAGRLPQRYRAAQGSRIGRSGRIDIEARDGAVWVGGEVVTRIVGEIS